MAVFVKDKEFYQRFFSLTIVIALQNVIVFSVNLADNIMLGAYAQDALSGVALCNQIQFILQMLVMGVGEGMLVFAARYWGEKRIDPIWRITNIGMLLAVVSSLLLAAVVYLWPHQTLRLLSDEEPVLAEGVRYLKIICFTYPIFAVTNILLSMLRSVETVRIGFYVSLAALLANVFLNYALIFGHFGFPRMGVEGAAIATLISRVLEMLIVLFYTFFVDKKVRLRLHAFGKLDLSLLKDYFRYGSPVLFSNLSWGVAMAVQTAILGRMGSDTIAANSIATTVMQIMSVVAYASASATSVVIGKAIGEGRISDVKAYAKTLQVLYLIIGVVTGAAIFVSKDAIISLYNVTDTARELAVIFMIVLAFTSLGTAYQMPCLTGIVRAGGDTAFVLKNDAIFQWCIILPVSLLAAFVFNASPLVVFICLKSDQVLKCAVAVPKVNRYTWIRALH